MKANTCQWVSTIAIPIALFIMGGIYYELREGRSDRTTLKTNVAVTVEKVANIETAMVKLPAAEKQITRLLVVAGSLTTSVKEHKDRMEAQERATAALTASQKQNDLLIRAMFNGRIKKQ